MTESGIISTRKINFERRFSKAPVVNSEASKIKFNKSTTKQDAVFLVYWLCNQPFTSANPRSSNRVLQMNFSLDGKPITEVSLCSIKSQLLQKEGGKHPSKKMTDAINTLAKRLESECDLQVKHEP